MVYCFFKIIQRRSAAYYPVRGALLQQQSNRFKFAGHQTFSFRYGWLEKGVKAAADDSLVFSDKGRAMVRLGVGKNMVQSIQYWCQVTQLLEARVEDRKSRFAPSDLARRLFLGSDPWDEFLEDDGSLWLIHWLLTSYPIHKTIWQVLFSQFHRSDFTRKELIGFIISLAARDGVPVAESVISRDVDCFLRTYLPGKSKKMAGVPSEETYDCPLIELGLIQSCGDDEFYRFLVGTKPSLPSAIFGFALLQYFRTLSDGRNTFSVQECMYGLNSPGQIFKLDENSLIEYVEELETSTGGMLVMDETAGLKQVYRRKLIDPISLLECHYHPEADNGR